MITPLEQLVEALEEQGEPPLGWRARHAPDGDLRALWDACELPGVLYRLATPPDAAMSAGAPSLECAIIAIDLASLGGTPWATFVEQLRTGAEFADNILDEAEPLFNAESQASTPAVHLAMTAVYRALLAEDFNHGDDPVRAGLGAVEAATQLERLVTSGVPTRVLTALRESLACPTLDAAIEHYASAARVRVN